MINYDEKIIEIFAQRAKNNYVDTINIGLGYTAVVLKNGSCGVCCTLIDSKNSCTVYKESEDYEQKNCYDLLITLRYLNDSVSRAVVIAMINALSASDKTNLRVDKNTLFNDLKLEVGDKLAMIGYFKPIVNQAKEKGVFVKAYDIGKEIGDEESFYKYVNQESSALIITATSFINNSFSDIIKRIENYKKPVALLGPSTIMEEQLYQDTPITILGGTFVTNSKGVLKAIRNGKGTPQIHKNSEKNYYLLSQ